MKKSKRKIKRYIETYDNEDTTIQNLQDTAEAILIGKFIAIQSYQESRTNANKQPKLAP